MEIRKSTAADLEQIMALYGQARDFMRQSGNPNQWGNAYPSREMISADIAAGKSYLCLEGGRVAAVFYFAVEEEPTYRVIQQGSWLCPGPYGVVHRIASSREVRGAASFCLTWCYRQCGNLRIDTHRENIPMQRCLARNGFSYCGIIHIADGSERIAFQKPPQRESV